MILKVKILKANYYFQKKPASKPGGTKPKGPSKFAAFRAQMKQQKQQQQEKEEAMEETPAQENLLQVPEQETKTFEAGFFKVKSPVKSLENRCEGKAHTSKVHTIMLGMYMRISSLKYSITISHSLNFCKLLYSVIF